VYYLVDCIYYGKLDEDQKYIAASRVRILHLLLSTRKPSNLRTLASRRHIDDSLKRWYGLLLQAPGQAPQEALNSLMWYP
jgi:hypothetical protein